MEVSIGDKVFYQEKEYTIYYIYSSNYCELREERSYRTILVHIDEIKCN
ncbi:hypothetical protein M670_00835 [Schinkia azotoformans MEV2011]|uniref:Uncharacterized protein n=1 Tax=Schinkia azotoformans MEV2011 TaxID=1348973 RepID=A0A072NQP7_SCHAZ|nr:hypothetical protein M670_00835 [Schinkia azotoformans MEV2011]